MRVTDELPRGRDDCPRADCGQSLIRVEERIINGSKALVYWHEITEGHKEYCIETPDGETKHFTREEQKRGSKA